MADFILATDFIGEFKLPGDGFNLAITGDAINVNWETIVRRILGVTLGNAVIEYIGDPDPVNDDFDYIINPFQLDSDCGIIESKGLKYAVMGQIYFSRQIGAKMQINSVSGSMTPSVESAENSSTVHSVVFDKTNDTIRTIHAIQRYVADNRDKYPDFNGKRFLFEYKV